VNAYFEFYIGLLHYSLGLGAVQFQTAALSADTDNAQRPGHRVGFPPGRAYQYTPYAHIPCLTEPMDTRVPEKRFCRHDRMMLLLYV
jgi:hypothetical protein